MRECVVKNEWGLENVPISFFRIRQSRSLLETTIRPCPRMVYDRSDRQWQRHPGLKM